MRRPKRYGFDPAALRNVSIDNAVDFYYERKFGVRAETKLRKEAQNFLIYAER